MKKFLLLLSAVAISFTLTACGGEELAELPEAVTMDNLDEYLERPDVQYVDVRNFDDKMSTGYVAGFEMIPFFDYLEYENILVREDGWTFSDSNIKSEAALRELFDADKAIFIYCAGGTRAGFVKAALDSLGYENVYNLGGFGDYDGDAKVNGDGTYTLEPMVKGDFTPGTYYGFDNVGGYMAVVVVNEKGGIEDVIFDALDSGTTKQNLGEAYDMGVRSDPYVANYWYTHADALAAEVVANQGWSTISLTETAFDSSWDANTVPNHVIEFDGLAGATIGAEGFVFAWNDAISQATTAGTLGVVDTTLTAEQWAAAHGADSLADGKFFGLDEASGYFVYVTIEDGEIVDVLFDAFYNKYVGCIEDGTTTVNDAVAKSACVVADGDEQVYETHTKQELGADYTLASGITWAAEADELAAAIIENQGWNADWAIIEGATDADHDKFDGTDQDVIDDVAGVTIGIEGFKAAWEEALAKAQGVE